MSLIIDDLEVQQLAQAISLATGESITRVLEEALRERYARLEPARRKASVEELLAIFESAAASVKAPHVDHGDLLYDENGLPV